MLSAEQPRTPWDVNFQLLGFPVRIHPLFWLVGGLLGLGAAGDEDQGIRLLIWFVALFVSILIHELGHALTIRRFGRDAHIVLYAMGGLAIEGRPSGGFGSPWSLGSFESYTQWQPRQRTPLEQILISAAGPGIQFALLGLIAAGIYAAGGIIRTNQFPYLDPDFPGRGVSIHFREFIALMLQINLYWPLLNLLPVLPLDGGQIAMQVLMQHDPWAGVQRALWLSVFVGGGMALFALLYMHQVFTMMVFASLAASSFMTLQQMGGGRRPW